MTTKKELTQKFQHMSSFKHLMVPVDFSDCSYHAVDFATQLAKGTSTIVHMVHIVEFDLNWMGGEYEADEIDIYEEENSISSQLNETVNKAKELILKLEKAVESEGVKAISKIVYGDPIGELLTYQKEQQIDVSVMGSHGSRGLNEVLMGSVAQKFTRLSSGPVFIIKNNVEDFSFDNMVYCSDFNEDQINKNLQKVKTISEHYNSDLTLLFVNTPNKFEESIETMSRIQKASEENSLDNFKIDIFNAYWVEEGIVDYAEIHEPSVVTITTHGYKGVRRILNNNITESLVNHISVPLLVLNVKD
jgi:nucleotide-binding universal stress UspA family protein